MKLFRRYRESRAAVKALQQRAEKLAERGLTEEEGVQLGREIREFQHQQQRGPATYVFSGVAGRDFSSYPGVGLPSFAELVAKEKWNSPEVGWAIRDGMGLTVDTSPDEVRLRATDALFGAWERGVVTIERVDEALAILKQCREDSAHSGRPLPLEEVKRIVELMLNGPYFEPGEYSLHIGKLMPPLWQARFRPDALSRLMAELSAPELADVSTESAKLHIPTWVRPETGAP